MNLVQQLMTLVSQQLAWQFDTYTSLETKAIGLLAFDGALGAFVAVLHPMPEFLRVPFFATGGFLWCIYRKERKCLDAPTSPVGLGPCRRGPCRAL